MNTKKVLLIDPGKVSESWYNKRQTPSPPLAYVGTYLKQFGHEIKIIDMATYEIGVEELRKITERYSPDVVGVTAMSFNILSAFEVLRAVKEVDKNIFTVIGGAHVTAVPDRTLDECKDIDALVVGEGEVAMKKLCDDPRPGIYQEPFIEDLDLLPFPDWSLFDYSKYIKSPSFKFNEERFLYTISMTRGCSFRCKFCFPLHGRKIRFRSPKKAFSEIKNDYEKYGATFFYITDSTLITNRKRIEEFCQLIIDSGLDISFKCQSRVDTIDESIANLLKKAGCELMFFGAESGNDEILKRCGKNTTKEQIRNAVSIINKAGICTRASFIIGLEGDTKETIKETIEFAKELKEKYGLNQVAFHCLDLYPKTEFWNMVERGEGTLKRNFKNKYDWTIFSREKPSMVSGDIAIEEIENLKKKGDSI